MTPDTLPDLERVYMAAMLASPNAGKTDDGLRKARLAALLAVYRAGQEAQRDMPPTREMIDAGGDVDLDYETDTHYSISIGYCSEHAIPAASRAAAGGCVITKEELAERLNGREYRKEVTKQDAADAKSAGLVILYGASDDLAELEGAVRDEVGVYDGGTIYITPHGLLKRECEDEDCPHEEKRRATASTINAMWCDEPDYSWTYRTNIPHATFDVVEEGTKYCRGIVFALQDVPTVTEGAE